MGPELTSVVRAMRDQYDGLNPPVSDADLERHAGFFDALPGDVQDLYRDHDGSAALPSWDDDEGDDHYLSARLLPLAKAVETAVALDELSAPDPRLGRVAWLWYDEQSNYAGVHVDGPLRGFVVRFWHESPALCPAWRSVTSFLRSVVAAAAGDEVYNFLDVPADLPVVTDGGQAVADRALARSLLEWYAAETGDDEDDESRRRRYALCAMALTPVADMGSLLPLLADPDMWTPESAVSLFAFRRYDGPVDPFEALARDGRPNGDSAAMTFLARSRTRDASRAISRLRKTLTGEKRQLLDQWFGRRKFILPPSWP